MADAYEHENVGEPQDGKQNRTRNGAQHNQNDNEAEHLDKVGLRERLRHFTWAWFLATMSTGGTAIVLGVTPHKFRGLYTIGVIVFIFNVVLFLFLCSMMTARALIDRRRFLKSLEHPAEAFFFGSFWLSMATILCCAQIYGLTKDSQESWLIPALEILYWMYAACTLINAVQQYFVFIARTPARPIPMSPAWFLAGYSAMLTGTVSGVIASSQPPTARVPIIISGCGFQGFGMLISFVLIVMYIIRLMENGLPPPDVRPGMFIPVGTLGYTMVALIGQAHALPRDYGYFAAHPSSVDILQTMALFIAIFLWVFAFWLFAIAFCACIMGIRKMGFVLSWWAFIFPNVGFTVGTIQIGQELGSEAILWVGSAMTIAIVAIWLFTIGACVHAVWKKRIMWPGRDEDKGMFKEE